MTRSEATQELIDLFMWGEKYLEVDITYIMDGEPVDELLLLIASGKTDEALDLLRSIVKRFMEGSTGEKLIDSYLSDERERRRDSQVDAEIHQKLLQEA